jgi:transketolase
VIDLYSVKPVDTGTLAAAAAATGGRMVLAEDHHPEGGLGSAVLEALAGTGRTSLSIAHLAVTEMPGSGTGDELMDEAGISARHIAAAARRLAGRD